MVSDVYFSFWDTIGTIECGEGGVMATISMRGDGQYQVKIRIKGHPAVSKTFPTKRLAEQFAAATEIDMLRGEFILRKAVEVVTLEKCLIRYADERSAVKKGEKQELVRIKKLMQHPLAKKSVSQITVDDIENYVYERRKDKSQRNPAETVSESTIRLEVMLLSAVFEAAKSKRWNYCRTNPVRDIDSDARPGKSAERVRRLVSDEEVRLLAALDKRCKNRDIPLIVRFAIATAARQSEIIGKGSTSTRQAAPGLVWENINIAQRSAKLIDTKNGKDRVIPLSDSAIALLSSLPRPIGDGKVFNATQDGLIRSFAAACNDAGIVDLKFHDLRHEATSRMVEAGLSLLEIQSVTGL